MDETASRGKSALLSLAGNVYAHVALVLLIGLVSYSNAFDAPFQWDEKVLVVENPIVKDLGAFLDPSKASGAEAFQHEAFRQRYVGYLSFALNYAAGGNEVAGYHAVNLAVHLANALLLYLLLAITFRTPALEAAPSGERSGYVALFGSLLFVSHPIQTMAVTYVFQRLASLAALFYLLSLASYAGSRLSAGRPRRYGLYGLSLASAVLAMKTKENALTLPVAICLYEILFFRGGIRGRAARLVPIFLTMLIIPVSLSGIERPAGEIIEGAASARAETELTRPQYFFTQMSVIVTYLRLVLFPVNQNIDYDYPVFGSLFDAPVFLSALLHLSLLSFGLYLLIRSKGGGAASRLAAFGILWFYLALSVESSFIPLHMVINEYRVYLPSAGAFAALAAGAVFITGRIKDKRANAAMVFILCLVPLALAAGTYARNETWRSHIALWEDVVRKSPLNARGRNNLGSALHAGGFKARAEEHFRTAAMLDPFYADPQYNLGIMYLEEGRYALAAERLELALRAKPFWAEAHLNLARALNGEGERGEAGRHLKLALSIRPSAEAHYRLGALYFEEGDPEGAREEFLKALSINPGHVNARWFLDYMSGVEATPPPR